MGDFRFEINAVGGHGCSREVQDGQEVPGCDNPGCVDCLFARFVEDLRKTGTSVKDAVIVHWPNGGRTAVLDVFEQQYATVDGRSFPSAEPMKRFRRGHF